MYNIVLKSRLILENNGSVLLLAQTNQNGGKYTLLGGRIEAKEYATQALIREAYEESGITIEKRDLSLAHVLHKQKENETRITLYFKATKWKGIPVARERDKFKRIEWFPMNKLPKNASVTVKHVIDQYLNNKTYSELFKGKKLKNATKVSDISA